MLIGNFKRIERGVAQLAIFIALAHHWADGVNHVSGFEIPTRRDHCCSYRRAADSVAVFLNFRPALAANRASHAAENQFGIGGVDDGIGGLLGEVALMRMSSVWWIVIVIIKTSLSFY